MGVGTIDDDLFNFRWQGCMVICIPPFFFFYYFDKTSVSIFLSLFCAFL